MAPLYERRTGPRKIDLPSNLAPFSRCNPVLPGEFSGPPRNQFIASKIDPGPLPAKDDDIAFAPLTHLSLWIQSRHLPQSDSLGIYIDRLQRFDPKLRCVITLTADHALAQAKQADAEIAAGKYRGPLHGIPWGAKDLLDTAGIPTTYGAEPFRNRVPLQDSHRSSSPRRRRCRPRRKTKSRCTCSQRHLVRWSNHESLAARGGFLRLQRWPGAATAAGLVGFAIGSETGGSIVSPSMRCGVTGLRPTFGRVPRTGAMTLCWSLDKLGPMARSVEDTIHVLHAISGPDGGECLMHSKQTRFRCRLEILPACASAIFPTG